MRGNPYRHSIATTQYNGKQPSDNKKTCSHEQVFSRTDPVGAACYASASSSFVKSTVSHPSSKLAPLDSRPAMKIGRATIFW